MSQLLWLQQQERREMIGDVGGEREMAHWVHFRTLWRVLSKGGADNICILNILDTVEKSQ